VGFLHSLAPSCHALCTVALLLVPEGMLSQQLPAGGHGCGLSSQLTTAAFLYQKDLIWGSSWNQMIPPQIPPVSGIW
jgi:hypothetical protein